MTSLLAPGGRALLASSVEITAILRVPAIHAGRASPAPTLKSCLRGEVNTILSRIEVGSAEPDTARAPPQHVVVYTLACGRVTRKLAVAISGAYAESMRHHGGRRALWVASGDLPEATRSSDADRAAIFTADS